MEKLWGTGKKYSKELTWTHKKNTGRKVVENIRNRSKYLTVNTCHFRRKTGHNPWLETWHLRSCCSASSSSISSYMERSPLYIENVFKGTSRTSSPATFTPTGTTRAALTHSFQAHVEPTLVPPLGTKAALDSCYQGALELNSGLTLKNHLYHLIKATLMFYFRATDRLWGGGHRWWSFLKPHVLRSHWESRAENYLSEPCFSSFNVQSNHVFQTTLWKIVILQFWNRAHELPSLTSSMFMLMLLPMGPITYSATPEKADSTPEPLTVLS